jgi:ferredoxin
MPGNRDGTDTDDPPVDPADIGEVEAPSVEEKPYKVIFEANRCIGTGKCAEVSENWSLSLDTGLASPATYFLAADDLAHNVRAAEVCPAKKGDGVIHVVDRRTGEEIAPDPEGDGTLSVDW